MNKKMLKRTLIFAILFIFFFFISCGSEADLNSGSGEGGNDVVIETTRKIYYTCNITISSDNSNELIKKFKEKANLLEGYASNSSITYDKDNYASGKIIFKIPTNRLNEFLDYIDASKGVVKKSINATDITSQYNEALARIETLEASKESYLKSLENTSNYSEIITIKTRIEEIDIELARIYKEKESYDNLLDYSTVTIYFNSKEDNPNKTFFETYGNYLKNFFVGLFKVIMYMLPFAFVAGVILLIIFFATKLDKKAKAKKAANKKE